MLWPNPEDNRDLLNGMNGDPLRPDLLGQSRQILGLDNAHGQIQHGKIQLVNGFLGGKNHIGEIHRLAVLIFQAQTAVCLTDRCIGGPGDPDPGCVCLLRSLPHPLIAGTDVPGLLQHEKSLLCGAYAFIAADKYGKAQFLLQRAEGIAQIWLGQKQVAGRLGDGTCPVDLQNILHLLNGHNILP